MSDNQFEIKFSDIFIKKVCNRATQLLVDGKDSGIVDDKILGELSIFIDKEPESVLCIIPNDLLPDNLKDKKIFIGG